VAQNARLASGEAAPQDAGHSQSEHVPEAERARCAEEREGAVSKDFIACALVCVLEYALRDNKADQRAHGTARVHIPGSRARTQLSGHQTRPETRGEGEQDPRADSRRVHGSAIRG
jgi:hypothetical protein